MADAIRDVLVFMNAMLDSIAKLDADGLETLIGYLQSGENQTLKLRAPLILFLKEILEDQKEKTWEVEISGTVELECTKGKVHEEFQSRYPELADYCSVDKIHDAS